MFQSLVTTFSNIVTIVKNIARSNGNYKISEEHTSSKIGHQEIKAAGYLIYSKDNLNKSEKEGRVDDCNTYYKNALATKNFHESKASSVLHDSHNNPVKEGKGIGDSIEGMGSNIQIGSIFNSIDEAKTAIIMLCGAPVKKRSTDKEKFVIFSCYRTGSFETNVSILERKRQRESVKCDCPFQVRIKKEGDLFTVYRINSSHNHELLTIEEQEILPQNRFIPEDIKNKILELSKLGNLTTQQIMTLVEKQHFPEVKKTWSTRDVQNLVSGSFDRAREASDFINLLCCKRDEAGWIVKSDLDSSLRLQQVFWMSSAGLKFCADYDDVWEGDSTYKTNRFGMPLLLWTGVDNNGITVILAGALLSDETYESYVWACKQLRDATKTFSKVLFTDRDLNFSRAIAEVFPCTTHLLCRWHISQNIIKNLAGVLRGRLNEFMDEIWRISSLESIDEFQKFWEALKSMFSFESVHEYMSTLFVIREQWVFAYTHTHFVAGIASTQRQESANFQIKCNLVENSTLSNLIENFVKAEDSISSKIIKASMETKVFTNTPVDPILEDACRSLTHYAAAIARQEGALYVHYVVKDLDCQEDCKVFEVSHKDHPLKSRTVSITGSEGRLTVECSCRKMIWHGIVCRHILAVLRRLSIMKCPIFWFNHRWLIDEVQAPGRHERRVEKQIASALSIPVVHKLSEEQKFAELSCKTKFLLAHAINDEQIYDIVKTGLESLESSVKKKPLKFYSVSIYLIGGPINVGLHTF